MASARPQTTRTMAFWAIVRIALIVAVAEGGITLLLPLLNLPLSHRQSVLTATLLLVFFSAPLIYWLVVRPPMAERERQLRESEYLATHDELTKLCNRRMFYDHLEHCLAGLQRKQRVGGLIYVDLDGFKPVNDEFGHEMGDNVLIEVGRRLLRAVRAEDVVARLGGDEFALLISPSGGDLDTVREQAREIAERILELISQPMAFQARLVQVGCSIGIHLATAEDANARTAMKAADQAMYRAKQQSGSIVFADSLQQPGYKLFKIGVAEIDHEHQEIDNLLQELVLRGECNMAALRGFIALVEEHFNSEVSISKRLGLNMTAAHLRSHADLLQYLHRLTKQPLLEDWSIPLTEVGMLLEDHVRVHDRALRELNPCAQALPA